MKPLLPIVTLCYFLKEINGAWHICCGWKEPTPGAILRRIQNRWTGWGGKKKETDPTPEHAALRELQEESGVVATINQLEKVAVVTYRRKGIRSCVCYIYFLRIPQAEPQPSAEISSPYWFPVNNLPYTTMVDGDDLVLEPALQGKKVRATITRNQEMLVVPSKTRVRLVDSF